jgi:peptidoglycan hydrolase-like amidase
MEQKEKIKKIAYTCLAAAFFLSVCGVFFLRANVAEAAKPTKWQTMLEQAGIPQSFWQKCLPKVKRSEYNRVKKLWAKSGGAATSAATVQPSSLGPEIAVGLWYNSKDDIFKIDANKTYNIKDKNGTVIAQVAGDSTTRVKADDNGKLKVYSSIADTLVDDNVTFDAADGDNSSIIFDVHRDVNYDGYDHFRSKIEVNYYHGDDVYNGNSSSTTQIWIINKLPLEQYVWGMGETTGTGDPDHVRVMATIFRTYGDWYIENATKYKPMGFKIRSDSGSQIYVGSDREKTYPKVRQAAEETRGKIVRYKGEVALTPYCSYTDGKTRKYPDSDYPYLKSVKDPYGKKKGLKPGEGGNHMWGLSAHGALGYAEHGKSWDWILKHYYTKVDIDGAY